MTRNTLTQGVRCTHCGMMTYSEISARQRSCYRHQVRGEWFDTQRKKYFTLRVTRLLRESPVALSTTTILSSVNDVESAHSCERKYLHRLLVLLRRDGVVLSSRLGNSCYWWLA